MLFECIYRFTLGGKIQKASGVHMLPQVTHNTTLEVV
jgi:hypothetical protein